MTKHELQNTTSCNACICCNGLLERSTEVMAIIRSVELLIAADGGARNLADIGLKPHVIIGDMDSLDSTLWLEDPLIQKVQFPRNKNKSDGELAVEWAFRHGCGKVILLGASGDRMDHVFAHGALLMRYPARLFMWHDDYLLLALKSGQEIVLPVSVGSMVSLLTFDNRTRIQTKGLKYALNNQSLKSPTHGLSNWAEKSNPVVTVTDGQVLLSWQGGRDWLDVVVDNPKISDINCH